tara:strand:- start:389 stop:625 length:237 start_codon:yes stop_codon:yes gene_type:complete
MNIDVKTICFIAIPLIGVAAAWGESMERLNALEAAQAELVNKDQLQVIQVEVKYIAEQVDENKQILKNIWGVVNENSK